MLKGRFAQILLSRVSSIADDRAVASERVGQILGNRWRLDRLLDLGGTGAVYEATHRNANRVAIKVLHRKYVADEDIKSRFLRRGTPRTGWATRAR